MMEFHGFFLLVNDTGIPKVTKNTIIVIRSKPIVVEAVVVVVEAVDLVVIVVVVVVGDKIPVILNLLMKASKSPLNVVSKASEEIGKLDEDVKPTKKVL